MAKMNRRSMEGDADKLDLQAATLVGDVRDMMLNYFKQHTDWKSMKQNKQEEIASGCLHLAQEMVRRTSGLVSSRGFPSFHANLQQITIKDGFKAVITGSKQVECLKEIMDHQGGGVTVVLTDISPYLGQRSEPVIDLDEPKLFGDNS